jgi:hypothetical protein
LVGVLLVPAGRARAVLAAVVPSTVSEQVDWEVMPISGGREAMRSVVGGARRWFALPSVVTLFAVLAIGCGSDLVSDQPPEELLSTLPEIATSTLPRTTSQSITITLTEQVETAALEGCHSFGESGREPPPGGCLVEVMVHEYAAQLDDEVVTKSYHDDVNVDPLYAMQLVGRKLTDGVSLVVVMPPPHATVVRLIDSTGEVVDQVTPTDRIVALAGLGADLTPEALSADGVVLAACPPDGVVHDGITYQCTFVSGAVIPSTTTTFVEN